jgi:hypothetical protein
MIVGIINEEVTDSMKTQKVSDTFYGRMREKYIKIAEEEYGIKNCHAMMLASYIVDRKPLTSILHDIVTCREISGWVRSMCENIDLDADQCKRFIEDNFPENTHGSNKNYQAHLIK